MNDQRQAQTNSSPRLDSLAIRPYQPSDELAVVSLWERCGLTRPWNNPRRDIARKLEVQPDLFLVAVLGAEVVGSLMAGYEGHRGWINYLHFAWVRHNSTKYSAATPRPAATYNTMLQTQSGASAVSAWYRESCLYYYLCIYHKF